MGITDFTTAFSSSGSIMIGKVEYSIIIVDAFLEIYRTSLGRSPLTDSSGRPTGYINSLWQTIVRLIKQHNIMIWVFDSPAPNKLKEREQARRKKLREDAATEEIDAGSDIEVERKEQLRRRQFVITPGMIAAIKFILRSLGVRYVDAPAEYEAEHLCACLARMFEESSIRGFWPNLPRDVKPVVYVMTRDPDALVYGAPRLLWKDTTKSGRYTIYVLDDILEETLSNVLKYYEGDVEVTMETFVKLCVALGADICPTGKVKGVGPKTVFRRIFELEFDDMQTMAIERFLSPCPTQQKITHYPITKESVMDLIEWLVEDRSFRRSRVEKVMKDFI